MEACGRWTRKGGEGTGQQKATAVTLRARGTGQYRDDEGGRGPRVESWIGGDLSYVVKVREESGLDSQVSEWGSTLGR